MKPSFACLLLGLCQIGSAAAIGLGEATVRSHLGQPLHASVAVLGATPELTADCFRIDSPGNGLASPLRATLSLERVNGQAMLHIRTPQAVNDPVTQFVVIAECETRLQRDYVVLLDPPVLAQQAIQADSAPPVQAMSASQGSTPPPPADSLVPATARLTDTAPRKSVRRPQPAGTPRLVLSGRRHVPAVPVQSFLLRLDTTLPDPGRIASETLTPTELSDENTALSRKLAYMETQLAALQKRNAELEALQQRAAAPTPARPDKPQWPLYLLAVGLLGGGAALAAWLRRRAQPHADTVLPDTLAWTPNTAQAGGDTSTGARPASEGLTQAPVVRLADIPPPAAQPEGTEVKEDILDQAEVFMAHGHGELAVHLLQEHLREAPTESPVPWLLLLDLLHRAGDSSGYAAAATECRRYFNINLSGHPVSQDGNDPGLGLEAYPHLLEKLVHVWNTPEIDAFFEDLIYDKRGGTRLGFEPGAYRDILLLRDIAQQALPLAA